MRFTLLADGWSMQILNEMLHGLKPDFGVIRMIAEP
jgi:hypothetical protein